MNASPSPQHNIETHTIDTPTIKEQEPATSGNTQTPMSHRYYIFLIAYLVGLSAFGSFVNDMYLPSLPEMTHYFHCSVSTVQLGLTFGMIGLGGGQMILGPLSDKFGRKPVLYITLIIFGIASVVSIFSPNIGFFLGCRLVQGLGASGGYFLARTIPADIYGGRALAKVMALIGAINGFAPASSPVIGGILDHTFGWKSVFWLLAGIAVLLWVLALFLQESLPKDKRYTGKIIDSFKEYKTLFTNKRFMIHVMLKGSSLGLLFAYVSSAPFIFQDHFGWSPMQFGFFMGFNAAFIALGAILALKFRYLKTAAYVAGWLLLASTAVMTFILNVFNSFWGMELAIIPMVLGMGMIFTVSNTLAMNEGRANAGGASAVLGMVGYVFGATLAPIVGLGNIIHSSSIVICIMAVVTLIFAYISNRLSPDSNMSSGK